VIFISEEMAIHVFALKVTSIVTGYNTVWIYDWNNPDLVELSKLVAQ